MQNRPRLFESVEAEEEKECWQKKKKREKNIYKFVS